MWGDGYFYPVYLGQAFWRQHLIRASYSQQRAMCQERQTLGADSRLIQVVQGKHHCEFVLLRQSLHKGQYFGLIL
jgi:hypothetical protein